MFLSPSVIDGVWSLGRNAETIHFVSFFPFSGLSAGIYLVWFEITVPIYLFHLQLSS